METNDRKTRAALLSVASNTTLIVLKLIVGALIGSVSVISEAIHSGVDLLASLIATFAVRTSARPADDEHPFGHGKVENVSGTVEAVLIFLAAGWIIYEAVHRLIFPRPIEATYLGVAVMLVSAVANLAVSHILFKVGRQTDSVALEADAWHLRTDVYTSVGVMFGLALIWLHELFLPRIYLHWVDPAAAIGVAALIVKAALELTLKSARDLLDVRLPSEEVEWIREYVCSQRPRIVGFHKLRTRKSGAQRFVEFHLLVRPDMSVDESHAITDEATRAIQQQFPSTTVTIHVEPCSGDCVSNCRLDCPGANGEDD